MIWPRAPLDVAAYVQEVTGPRPCFICRLAAESPPGHEVVYRDQRHLVFLPRYPTLEGYVLVAPVEHREQVVSDFSLGEYVELQSFVHQVGRALSEVVPTERLYLLSMGSQQGNRHVHWHVAALPPGVPFEDQQISALTAERTGYLVISEEARDKFSARLRAALSSSDRS